MVLTRETCKRLALAAGLTFGLSLGTLTPTLAAPGSPAPATFASLHDDDDDGGVYRPVPRPVTLVEGSCDAPGARIASLNRLSSPNGDDSGTGKRAEYGYTASIPVSLDDLMSGTYALLVHESEGVMDNIIA
jgi:hypothetical protein